MGAVALSIHLMYAYYVSLVFVLYKQSDWLMERLKGKCLDNVYGFIVQAYGGISMNCTFTMLSGTFSWVYLWKKSRLSQRFTGIKAIILGMSQWLAFVDSQ